MHRLIWACLWTGWAWEAAVFILCIKCTVFTLSICTDRPKQTAYLDQMPQMRHLICINPICHFSNLFLNTTIGSEMDLVKVQDKYGKELRYLNTQCNYSMVNVLKFLTLYSILSWLKFCFLCSCFLKYLVEWQTM